MPPTAKLCATAQVTHYFLAARYSSINTDKYMGEIEMASHDDPHGSAALHAEWMQLALPVARAVLSRA